MCYQIRCTIQIDRREMQPGTTRCWTLGLGRRRARSAPFNSVLSLCRCTFSFLSTLLVHRPEFIYHALFLQMGLFICHKINGNCSHYANGTVHYKNGGGLNRAMCQSNHTRCLILAEMVPSTKKLSVNKYLNYTLAKCGPGQTNETYRLNDPLTVHVHFAYELMYVLIHY